MDLYDRKIISYTYRMSMTANPFLKALENACLNVKYISKIVLHSDLDLSKEK